jgi:NADH-quinone oxidoreductase subunit E
MNDSVRAAGFSPGGAPRDLKVAARRRNAPAFLPGTRIDAQLVNSILDRYAEGDGTGLIHALQDIQAEFGYVPCQAAELLCERMKVPISKAFSVATFYKAFSLEPKGEVIIRVCTGTACHIRGAQTLVDEICATLGVAPGQTTKDLKFTLETVNCVGACAMAPVVSLNGKYHGKVQPGALTRKIQGGK